MASTEEPKKVIYEKRAIERILTGCSVYLRCDIICYDDKMHNSVDRVIGQLENVEQDINTPDEMLPQIAERHLEMINLRMKLLKLKRDQSVLDNTGDSRKESTTSQKETVISKKEPSPATSLKETLQKEPSQSAKEPANLNSAKKIAVTPSVSVRCVYCKESHLSELCSLPLSNKTNFLKKKKLCFKCLSPINPKPHECDGKCTVCPGAHHVSICRTKNKQIKEESKQSTSSNTIVPHIVPPPIKEPQLPNQQTLRIPNPIVHPNSIFVSLISAIGPNNGKVVYTPTITVRAESQSNVEMARAYINFSTATNSFVSPQLLNRLKMKPIKLSSPIMVETTIGQPFNINSYVILEVSSLYKKDFRYKRVFYVHDITHHHIKPATDRVKKLAKERGVTLSNELFHGQTNLDFLIGMDQCDLTAFQMTQQLRVTLGDEDNFHVAAYYTHFGYLLMGTETKKDGPKFVKHNLSYDPNY